MENRIQSVAAFVKKEKLKIIVPVLLFAGAMSALLYLARAAGPFVAYEAEETTSSGTVLKSATDASGGKYIEFVAPSTTPPPPTSGTCSGTNVAAGSDLVSVANNNPAGTTFCLAAGTFAIGSSLPIQTGDKWVGALDGNGQRLSIITGNNTTSYFVTATSSGATLRNMVIEKFNNPAQQGVNSGAQTSYLVENVELRYNGGHGWHTHDDTIVRNSFIHHNLQAGLGGQGDRVLVENNEISYNNYLGKYDWGWEAGGSKWVQAVNLTVRGNFSHHNCGPGLWTDSPGNQNVIYENNRLEDNHGPGIMHEISGSAIIRNNTLKNNAWGDSSGLCSQPNIASGYRGGILISESHPVEVYGNTLYGNDGGIIAIDNERGSGNYVANLYVHDNDITITRSSSDVASGCYDYGSTYNCYANNNRWENNKYHVGTYLSSPFWWQGSAKTWSQWRSYGFDANGTIN